MKTVAEILNDWETESLNDWYAVDRIATDGRMLRLFVGDRAEATRLAVQFVTEGTVDYDGSIAAPGTWEEPWHRMGLIGPEAARDYFEGLAKRLPDVGTMYTLTQAAERMGVSRQAVHGLIKRGRLRAEVVGGEYRITGGAIARR